MRFTLPKRSRSPWETFGHTLAAVHGVIRRQYKERVDIACQAMSNRNTKGTLRGADLMSAAGTRASMNDSLGEEAIAPPPRTVLREAARLP